MVRKSLLEPAFEPIDLLIGITTTLRDYRAAYFLNKALNFDLKAVDDLPVYHDKLKHLVHFPLFWYYHDELRTNFYLIANNNGEMLMLSALRNFNYFLIVKSDATHDQFKEIPRLLREIPGIQAAFPIAPETVKNMAYILSDLELHMIDVLKDDILH